MTGRLKADQGLQGFVAWSARGMRAVRVRLSWPATLTEGEGTLPILIIRRAGGAPSRASPAQERVDTRLRRDRLVRPGAWVAELTGLLELPGWPKGMRIIARRKRPHPGAQLCFTDVDGNRVTCFVTNTKQGQLADLELHHRRRARAEDRIRCANDTGLAHLPLHHFVRNQIWCELVALVCELLVWMQLLALPGTAAQTYEPKRLRLRLFTAPDDWCAVAAVCACA